ncbi:MAG: ferritin-like domain-containing protein [Chitinophagaceae bacterium]
MDLQNIIVEISKSDPEVYDRLDGRRESLKKFSRFAGKVALASIPFAFGSLFKRAYAGTTGTNDIITDVLNFALTLEYLEAEFYQKGLDAAGLIPAGAARNAIQTIANHEAAHVTFLKSAIAGAGGTAVPKPTFDFSAGNGSGNGPFKTVFTDYTIFLAVAQAFEDTGVRAYKGQAGNLISNNDVLTAALNIHSVEARHASHIRQMRRATGANVKPWITGKDTGGIGAGVQPVYDGEENTKQATIEIVNINGMAITADDATEAFDEPLTKDQVLAIVDPFIA